MANPYEPFKRSLDSFDWLKINSRKSVREGILASFFGLLILWPVLLIVAIMVKIKMPGGPAFFCQKRVGKDSGWSSVSVAGDSRITPFGAKLRHYKIDELPELWDVLIGNMSFVGPRPDVPGYADQLQGEDRVVLKLRPGITGPATLKYRLEDEMIADFVRKARSYENDNENENFGFALPENVGEMSDQEIAVWYNDNVIYPDKVRLNKYYYEHYSFWKDIEMILATVLGRKVKFNNETI